MIPFHDTTSAIFDRIAQTTLACQHAIQLAYQHAMQHQASWMAVQASRLYDWSAYPHVAQLAADLLSGHYFAVRDAVDRLSYDTEDKLSRTLMEYVAQFKHPCSKVEVKEYKVVEFKKEQSLSFSLHEKKASAQNEQGSRLDSQVETLNEEILFKKRNILPLEGSSFGCFTPHQSADPFSLNSLFEINTESKNSKTKAMSSFFFRYS